MKTKLTLVRLYARGKTLTTFVNLLSINGKTVVSQKMNDYLFKKHLGFVPKTWEVISFL